MDLSTLCGLYDSHHPHLRTVKIVHATEIIYPTYMRINQKRNIEQCLLFFIILNFTIVFLDIVYKWFAIQVQQYILRICYQAVSVLIVRTKYSGSCPTADRQVSDEQCQLS